MSRPNSGDTRRDLLAAARRLLVERGYHAVGLNEIARAAGVSRQAVYQGHFASKADLLLALVDEVDREADVAGKVARLREARDGVEALDVAVEVVASIEDEIHDIARVFETASAADPAFEAAWQDRMRARRAFAAGVVRRLAAEGQLAEGWTIDEAADYLWSVLSVWTYQALVVERGWSHPRYVERLQAVLRAALVAEPPG